MVAPSEWQRRILHRSLWKKQRDICSAIDNRISVSVKGCHASGKTFVASGIVPYWLLSDPEAICLVIAPTLRQVKTFWNEVTTAFQSLPAPTPDPSTVSIRFTEKNYALGFSSSKGVNAQGFHGKKVLIIADEAPGISGDVWDAIEGIRAGGDVRLLKLGNPTVASGTFYEDFRRGRATTECITISAFDTPNLTGVSLEQLLAMDEHQLAVCKNPYLVTRRWVREKYERWGPNNPRYVSRVLGEFPSQSDHALFDLAWIERAKRQPTEHELAGTAGRVVQVGIDVAGPGDDETAACARINGIVIARKSWPDSDPRGAVVKWLGDLRRTCGYRLGPVVVDVVGIGYNFALHLADNGFEVMGFSAGRTPMNREQFMNAKAESFWRLRDMYKADYMSHLEEALDEETDAQLTGIEYRETSRGLTQIEPKEEARKRGVSSPDRAEAQMMAFCQVIPQQMTVSYGAAPDLTIA